MPSRPDLREISSNVREAFSEADRETLLDILTFVIKEYVVEGPPPMMIHQAETLSDLKGATFAQLITAMQTRFDHPELAMFVVDGEQVSVRVGGVVQPLLAQRTPMGGTAADLPRPAAGVRVVETGLQQRPPQPAPPASGVQMIDTRPAPAPQPQSSAPPPARGVSVRSPGEAAPARPAPATPAAGQSVQPAAQPAAQPAEKPEGGGDDASARFSLLELD
jgi:hypothetical protein